MYYDTLLKKILKSVRYMGISYRMNLDSTIRLVNKTGCMFCGFGAHLEAELNRFQRMLVTHPKHYKICMNLTNNGVRYEEALNACGIPTKTWEQAGQLSLDLKNAA